MVNCQILIAVVTCLITFTSVSTTTIADVVVSSGSTNSDDGSGQTLRDNVETAGEASTSAYFTSEIYASFSDEAKAANHQLGVEQSIFNQVHVAPDLSETVEEMVLTLAGSATESDVPGNLTEDRYVVRAEPRVPGEQLVPETPEITTESTASSERAEDNVTESVPSSHSEDIPSFSEWTQQQLAERRRADPNVTEKVRSNKVRIKNFASPDCGAKTVAANSEAVRASAVLSSARDDYMLNHCTARIWFIVELCEAVQAKQLDLANFELFSSSPKDFSVYIGSRFPSRDWQPVGKFTAKDTRDIQTFDLNPYLFGKYLKVEVHSHYGKEHYCPLSWVRVYGTSEYEVLATEDDRHGDDDDDVPEDEKAYAPKNLFSSATDAVLSIVKKATAPFMKAEEGQPIKAPILLPPCITPRYLTVCDNCSQHIYDHLYDLLSCRSSQLYDFVDSPYVRRTLIQTDTCTRYGLDFVTLRQGAVYPLAIAPDKQNYLSALLKESYIAALCNVLAVQESRVFVNMTDVSMEKKLIEESPIPLPAMTLLPSSTCIAPDYSTSASFSSVTDANLQIKPTKTLKEEEVKNLPKLPETGTSIKMAVSPTSETKAATKFVTVIPSASVEVKEPTKDEPVEVDDKKVLEEQPLKEVQRDATLDAILQDLSELEKVVNDRPQSSTPPPSPPKDSIFLRLANRIKNLELNMSLSSSYLEELSRRYRMQVETLGQTVNVTARRLEEQTRMEELKMRRRDEEIAELRAQLSSITKDMGILMQERNSWFPKTSRIFCILFEIFLLWYVVNRWGRTDPVPIVQASHYRQPRRPKRRNSVEGVPGHVSPHRTLERRPSDEALEITLTTNYSSMDRRKKKKRKEGSRKSSAVEAKRKKSNSFEVETLRVHPPIMRQASEPPPESTFFTFTPDSEVTTSNRFAAFASPVRADTQTLLEMTPPPPPRPQLTRRFSSPAFMRTAMSVRSSRGSDSSEQTDVERRPKKESGFKKYMRKLF